MAMEKEISNWGSFPKLKAKVDEPEFIDDLSNIVINSQSILARGNGRCYGDAALNGELLSTLKLNKFLSFEKETGIIEVQAGVLLSEILNFSVPKGYFLPVTPGTKFITVGGAIAADIHGKNHHSEGCFGDHTLYFDLMLGDGKTVRCSREQNAELFYATLGGMGLTGIIVAAAFRLKPVETAYIRMESIKAKNLDEAMKLFDESAEWTYTVSWIDCLQKGKNIGRSIMMRGEHATVDELPAKYKANPLKLKDKLRLNVPFNFPDFVLNTLGVKAFNFAYWNKQQSRFKKSIIDYDTYFYPLDSIHNWNRIYGKNGFIQYQFVLPPETSRQGLLDILTCISDSGQGSFLAVLKLFGNGNPKAVNSFPMAGYTLALDFKRNKKLPDLVNRMDEIVARCGGRIYLAKDSMSTPNNIIFDQSINANNKFRSEQNNRLFHQI